MYCLVSCEVLVVWAVKIVVLCGMMPCSVVSVVMQKQQDPLQHYTLLPEYTASYPISHRVSYACYKNTAFTYTIISVGSVTIY